MKSPQVAACNPPEEIGRFSDLQVLHSPAGHYIGTTYSNPAGYTEPGSRDSRYFDTQEEAEGALRWLEDQPYESAIKWLRMTP